MKTIPNDGWSHTTSLWMAQGEESVGFPRLLDDTTADVIVVGAGIAGLSTAYLLARSGKHVVVLEDGVPGSGETGRTTAHLSSVLDDRYFDIQRLHGTKSAAIAARSHVAAIDRVEEIVASEGIECGFERVDGLLFLEPGSDRENLEKELKAVHAAGLDASLSDSSPFGTPALGPALVFPRQAQFHPLQYLAGLAKGFARMNGRIFSRTRAVKIHGGSPARVVTESGHTVAADAVVVATNTPVNDLVVMHTKQAPYRTYVVGARVPAGSIPRALYWDTADPYHYARVVSSDPRRSPGASAHDLLIIGGEDHKTGQDGESAKKFSRLESWARAIFPGVEGVEFRWSGQVLEPVDGLAFIGRNPLDMSNVYIATGASGNGMTYGTIAGMLLTNIILGRQDEAESLYDPGRITPGAARDFAHENLNVAAQYMEWFTKGGAVSADEIAPGTGAILRRGLSKVAVARDKLGKVHECSAVCPHLGCIVAWNATEQTWDCPCHGSRFEPNGKVITGPAVNDLAPARVDEGPVRSKASGEDHGRNVE